MGKIVVAEKNNKKKGRPSLIQLQKRSFKLNNNSNKNPIFKNPNPNRRSTRRNPSPHPHSDDDDVSGGDEVTGKKRKEKKLNKIVSNSGSDSEKKRKRVDSIILSGGSALGVDDKGEKHGSGTNKASFQQETKVEDGPSTPLPDKKLLLFIIERLQKKDTYGVFSEPVDPEELPDYHEVVSDPMDFCTLRKKLNDGAYASLEQFEKDVLLICSNAMQYNASDTIYFRQARGIKELAKKDFENLRKEDGDEPEPEPEPEPEAEPKVVRRGRPPKNLKRPPGRPSLERASSNISEATTTGGSTNRSSVGNAARSYNGNINRSNNDIKTPPVLDKQGSTNLFKRSTYGLNLGQASVGWSAERNDNKSEDMIGSASKGSSMKLSKKTIVFDESRRNTYKQNSTSACRQTSLLTTFNGERKLLFPIGIQTEHGYVRSLSRFAAKLGPVAWKVASAKISKCLPPGVKFGPGWVGDGEAPAKHPTQQQSPGSTKQLSTPVSTPSQVILETCTDESAKKAKDKQLLEGPMPSKCDDGPNTTPISSKADAQMAGTNFHPSMPFNMLSSNSSAMKSALTNSIAHNQSRFNGLNGSYGLNFAAQMSKIIGSTRGNEPPDHQPSHNLGPPSGDSNRSNKTANPLKNTSDSSPNRMLCQKVVAGPPDLNGSPVSGRSDSVQPDLALQL